NSMLKAVEFSNSSATFVVKRENRDTDEIGCESHRNDFCGEKQRVRHINDRIDGEEDGQQTYRETASRRDAQPGASSGSNRSRACDRDCKHDGIDNSVKNVGGVVHELKRFLQTGADLA